MAKLTKAQRRAIDSALASIDRAIAFIESDSVAICRPGKINAACQHGPDEYRQAQPFETVDYDGRDGAQWSIDWIRTLTPMSKGIGSDLVAIYTARRSLETFLSA